MGKNKNVTKRTTPSDKVLDWREEYLHSVKDQPFDKSYLDAPLLEAGNSKIGFESEHYDKVFVWNLPVVITCPGASKWCLRHCYNADLRPEKFPINDWNKNLLYFYNNETALEVELLKILNTKNTTIAVRIHSSGDFFSKAYIDFWKRIIHKTPTVKYWAYTRSWQRNDLINTLEELRTFENIQLFASWDNTMPTPPSNWRKSFVYVQDEALLNTGIICPEQSGKSPNCATCNYCLAKNKGDVYFILH